MSPTLVARAVLGAFFISVSAFATEPRRVRLDYERGATQCGDARELSDAVAADLGYAPFAPDARETLRVRIGASAAELTATIELFDARGSSAGRRELSSPERDCRELMAALALAVSIAIDPVHSGKEPEPEPQPAPEPEAPKPAPKPKTPKARPPPPQPKPQPSNLHLSLAGGALLATGTAPAQAIGFFGYAGARWPSVSFGIEGRADLPAEKSEPQGSASASLMLASLLPCVHVGVGFACAVGSLGALQGSGEDVSRPAKATTVFAAAGVRGGTDVPITESLGVVGFVDLRTNLTRTTLRLNDREVWSTPAFGGDLGVGLRGQL